MGKLGPVSYHQKEWKYQGKDKEYRYICYRFQGGHDGKGLNAVSASELSHKTIGGDSIIAVEYFYIWKSPENIKKAHHPQSDSENPKSS